MQMEQPAPQPSDERPRRPIRSKRPISTTPVSSYQEADRRIRPGAPNSLTHVETMVRPAKPVCLGCFPTTLARASTSAIPSMEAHSNPPAEPNHTSATAQAHTSMPSPVTATKLMTAYFAHGLLKHARETFVKMPHRDVVAWTAMISGYTSSGQHGDALLVFREMMEEGVAPNAYTVSIVLKACRGTQRWPAVALVHGLAFKCGVDGQAYVENALLDVYMACRGKSMCDACAIFEGIVNKTAVSWTTMIAGYIHHGDAHSAIQAFQRMLQEGVELSPFSCSAVIRACAMISSLAFGKQIHTAAVKLGYQMNLPVANSLLDMYCRCMSLSEAKQYFGEMPEKDLITWNTMIAGLEKLDRPEALELLVEMISHNLQPNCFTFTSIVAVCANLAILDCGQQVHGAVVRRGYGGNLPLANALVDMYAKCGSVGQSRRIFNRMAQKDLVSWTSMMIGYGTHGSAEEAIRLFDKMVYSGISPDLVVFMGLLNACSHAGLVDEGLKYFNLMVADYSVTPSQEIYGCVIDLLGRAGRINDAYELMEKMPFEPDRSVWGALLGACKMHGNAQIGKFAAQKIMDLKPDGAETYVMLSNIFAADGEWGEFAKTRRLLKGTGSRKEAGRSWIEVRGVVSSFVAGDEHHPQMGLVYEILGFLLENIKTKEHVCPFEGVT